MNYLDILAYFLIADKIDEYQHSYSLLLHVKYLAVVLGVSITNTMPKGPLTASTFHPPFTV